MLLAFLPLRMFSLHLNSSGTLGWTPDSGLTAVFFQHLKNVAPFLLALVSDEKSSHMNCPATLNNFYLL